MEPIDQSVEWIARGIELLAVAIIATASVFGTGRFLYRVSRKVDGAYLEYKVHLGKALLLGLELMVAADIVQSAAVAPTLRSVATLGFLVLIRTFLSWTLTIEIEQRLPWRKEKSSDL